MDSTSNFLELIGSTLTNCISSLTSRLQIVANSLSTSYQTAIYEEKSAIWATLITDIITIAAALGALALPMSLNVIETTRSRYKSPSLLKLGTILSKTDPQRLNRHLFTALLLALTAKLFLSARVLEPATLAPLLGILALYFSAIILKVYKHLKFTYKFISNIESNHAKTLGLIEKFSKLTFLAKPPRFKFTRQSRLRRAAKLPIQHIIPSFIELETYFICTNTKMSDIDHRFRELSYRALDSLDDPYAESFMHHLLDSFPPLLARVEISREVDIYQSVSGLYLYFTMKAILSNKSFVRHIPAIERIARFKEKNLPVYGRFCRTGRFFLDFAHQTSSQVSPYPYLLSHFKLLIDNATREQPENIPEIFANIGNVIQFKGNHRGGVWALPNEVEELWGYPSLIELNKLIEGAYDGKVELKDLKEAYEAAHKNQMIAYIEGKLSDKSLVTKKASSINIAIEKCWDDVTLNRFASDIEVETLRVLANLLTKDPEIFIDCRELRNPAGSWAINVGHSPIPSTIGECVARFLDPRYFDGHFFFRSDLPNYKIIDAIGALLIYELWDTYIIRSAGKKISTPPSCPSLPERTLGELKSASTRSPLLKNSLLKALGSTQLTQKLRLLPEQITILRDLALELHSSIDSTIQAQTKRLLSTQELDERRVEDFLNSYKDEMRKTISTFHLFTNVKVAEVKPIPMSFQITREAFLTGTDTHYILENFASPLVRQLNDWLCFKILSHNPNTLSSSTTLPTKKVAWIICSQNALADFESQGFNISGRYLSWPDGTHKVEYIKVNSETNNFYPVQPVERLAKVSYNITDYGLPIKITYNDDKEYVTFKIEHFIGI